MDGLSSNELHENSDVRCGCLGAVISSASLYKWLSFVSAWGRNRQHHIPFNNKQSFCARPYVPNYSRMREGLQQRYLTFKSLYLACAFGAHFPVDLNLLDSKLAALLRIKSPEDLTKSARSKQRALLPCLGLPERRRRCG